MQGLVVFQTAVGAVFLAAALGKLVTRGSVRPFLDALALPAAVSRVLTVGIVPAEALCGLVLIAGAGAWAALGSTVLAMAFFLFLLLARWSGATVGCRCFGPLDHGANIAVNTARAGTLAGACLLLTYLRLRGVGPGAPPVDATAVALGGVAAAEYIGGFALASRILAIADYRHKRRTRMELALAERGIGGA